MNVSHSCIIQGKGKKEKHTLKLVILARLL